MIKSQKKGYVVIDDFYIDMDGEAGASKTVSGGSVAVVWGGYNSYTGTCFCSYAWFNTRFACHWSKSGNFPSPFSKEEKKKLLKEN